MKTLKEDLKKYNIEEYKPLPYFLLSLATCGIYGIVKVVNRNWYNNYKLYMSVKMIRRNYLQLALKYLNKLKFNENNLTLKDNTQIQTYTDLIKLLENNIDVGPRKFENMIRHNDQILNLYKPSTKNKLSNKIKFVIGIVAVVIIAAIGSNNKDHERIVAYKQEQQQQPQQIQQVEPIQHEAIQQQPQEAKKEEVKQEATEKKAEEKTPTSNAATSSAAGDIIGDKNSHIYHLPTQKHYNIKAGNEVHFKTEQEAIDAGYRAAKR